MASGDGKHGRLIFDDSVTFPSTASTLPNGHFIANVDGCPPYNGFECDAFGAGNSSKTVTMNVDTLNWSTSFIYPDVDAVTAASSPVGDKSPHPLMWPDVPLQATECALYYCVKAVDSRMAGNQLLENITEFSSKRVRASSDAPPDTANSLEFNPLAFAGSYNADLYLKSPNASDPGFHVTTGAVMAISAYIQSLFHANYTDALGAQDLPSSFPRVRQELDTNLGTAGAVGLNGASFSPSGPAAGAGQSLDLEHDECDEHL